tara:strand:+ start:295 stop:522 length:228 start_codon:yes stop_codon:yes gene_type:complete
MMPGPTQILIIIILLILLFGASRVPGIMENLAKGITSFKKGLKEEDNEKQALEKSSTDTSKSEVKDSENKDKVDG